MSYNRVLRRHAYMGDEEELGIGQAAQRIYHLLWHGEYWDEVRQQRVPMQGKISKLRDIIGLGQKEKTMIDNFRFMSSKIAGTRQIRRNINHIVFSSRIVYGNPVFMTITPNPEEQFQGCGLFVACTINPGRTIPRTGLAHNM